MKAEKNNLAKKIKVCHFTSVHDRKDTRIFLKECSSLAEDGFDVTLIVADGQGLAEGNGIRIIDIGKENNRWKRFYRSGRKIYRAALKTNADIFHFHDPELIRYGLKLKKKGKKVIYDIHEDIPEQIKSKPYIHKLLSNLIAWFYKIYENRAARKFDYLIAATPFIKQRFFRINKKTIDVNNYPIADELASSIPDKTVKQRAVCYVGKITTIRGAYEMVRAMERFDDIRLYLGGQYYSSDLRDSLRNETGWKKVNELGFLNREEYRDILEKSMAGLVVFHSLPNHLNAQPNKIFEYMSAGIPVIASDFPLWKELVEKNNCGVCVNPLNPVEIADAIEYILNNPDRREEMGENGRKLIEEEYNWKEESKKLLRIYKGLI